MSKAKQVNLEKQVEQEHKSGEDFLKEHNRKNSHLINQEKENEDWVMEVKVEKIED